MRVVKWGLQNVLKSALVFVFIFPLLIANYSYAFDKKIGVVTMNVQGTEGNWKHRLYWIAADLAATNADIIAFQEVIKGYGFDQMHYLWDALKRNGWFGHGHAQWTHYSGRFGGDEYVFILSRKPPQERRKNMLSHGGFGRGYAALKVDGIWFVNAHLDLDHGWREKQVGDLLNTFRATGTMIMGDFNSTRDSWQLRGFRDRGYRGMFPDDGSIDGVWISGDIGRLFAHSKVEKRAWNLSDHQGVLVNIWNESKQ